MARDLIPCETKSSTCDIICHITYRMAPGHSPSAMESDDSIPDKSRKVKHIRKITGDMFQLTCKFRCAIFPYRLQ